MSGHECGNGPAFLVQDNATIWVRCLSTGQVACRQWSIADVLYVRFFGMEHTPLIAKETCRINNFSGHPLQAGKRFYLGHGVLVLPRGGIQSIPGAEPGEFVNLSICRGGGIHGDGPAACNERANE